MSIATRTTVDCRGMACPAPILAVSKATRTLDASVTTLQVLADDDGFPVDIKAWCRSTGAALASVDHEDGVYTALIFLGGERTDSPAPDRVAAPPKPVAVAPPPLEAAPAAATPTNPASESSAVDIDCRGMRCPAPIMAIAKAHRALGGDYGVLEVRADDGDFPVDLRAWCRSTGSELVSLDETDGVHRAVVQANPGKKPADPQPAPVDADPAPAPVAAPAPVEVAPGPAPAPVEVAPGPAPEAAAGPLDLTGESAQRLVLKLGAAWLDADGSLTFSCDAGADGSLQAWADLVSVTLEEVARDDSRLTITARPRQATDAPQPVVVSPPAVVEAPVEAAVEEEGVPRRNATTLLILRNDFESLMAAMMVANASAAQGMEVSVYFSFWGVNLLRADNPSPAAPGTAVAARPGLMHRMMKWMMPKGPERQTMSKMNMGGMGLGMMKYFMKQQNVLGLGELVQQAVEMGVTFKVCTMSMGIMGIEKRELMDLPNLEFGGVTAFTAEARTSASSMVF